MKNRILLIALATLVLWSCDQDNGDNRPDFVSVQDAKAAMEDMNVGLQQDLDEMLNSEGVNALSDLTDLMESPSEGFRKMQRTGISRIESTIKNFESVFSPLSKNQENPPEEDFDFEGSVGVYVWDFDLEDFVKTDADVEYLEIHFPTNESVTNDAVFKLLEFTQGEIDGELVPIKIVAQLYIDDQLELSLNLDVNYSFLGIVESVEISLFSRPYTFNFSFNLGSQSISFETSISKDDTEILSAGGSQVLLPRVVNLSWLV